MAGMQETDHITLKNGITYLLQDAKARAKLDELRNEVMEKSGIAIQDDEPTDGELVWIDTDDSGTTHIIPEIDDSSVSASDTWSSQKIRDFIYPIGSIYMSVNSTSPATIFGGTWEQLEDRFLLAAGSTYAAGSTGGEAAHTLTVTEMPSHRHGLTDGPANNAGRAGTGTSHFGTVQMDVVWASGYQTDATGGDQAHNNMPPYLAVYMWKRTA